MKSNILSKLLKLSTCALLGLCLAGNAMGIAPWPSDFDEKTGEFFGGETQGRLMSKSAHLEVIAKSYLTFLMDVFSVPAATADDPRLETLFAENLTKIENNFVLFVNNRDALYPQMTGFKQGGLESDWMLDIDHAYIRPSAETNSVTICFVWSHPKIGRHTTMAILECNAEMKIERIKEVWGPVKTEGFEDRALGEIMGEVERRGHWHPLS